MQDPIGPSDEPDGRRPKSSGGSDDFDDEDPYLMQTLRTCMKSVKPLSDLKIPS